MRLRIPLWILWYAGKPLWFFAGILSPELAWFFFVGIWMEPISQSKNDFDCTSPASPEKAARSY
jgi:hypothetical protein